jgi:hypothetical protein
LPASTPGFAEPPLELEQAAQRRVAASAVATEQARVIENLRTAHAGGRASAPASQL